VTRRGAASAPVPTGREAFAADPAGGYREGPVGVPGVVLWSRRVRPGSERARILPDGCLDLLWDGGELLVAGPDPAARWHTAPPGTSYVGVRLAGGLGPALLGVPADHLTDHVLALEQLWGSGPARRLADQVAADPPTELARWAAERARRLPADGLGPRLLAMAGAGLTVAAMAERSGLGARQLHRHCLALFGYGPRRLGRIVRLGRALEAAQAGAPLARAAAAAGYADQAHLSREVRALAGTTPAALVRDLRSPER